jgi:hypothetical protein
MAYTTINLEQFKATLPAERGWRQVENFGEYVFEWQIPSMPLSTVIKVYTTIRKRNDLSRFKGDDSIKICCVFSDQGLVRATRVYRVPGWQSRLQAAIRKVLNLARQRRNYIQGTKIVWPSMSKPKDAIDDSLPDDDNVYPDDGDNVYPPGHPLAGERA